MKKAIKINLGGLIFHIDEDAYDRLKQYLSALVNQFGNNNEAREIVSDIESRIAELFQSRLNQGKQVIVFSDVEEIIGIMGNPNEYDTNEATEEKQEYSAGPIYSDESRRRFYRDTDNSVLGGVCSGLGAYFRIDPVILRILFIVFTFIWGASLLIYIILWIALPAARTAAQKLEMRGEPVNVSNIEKKVKEEYEQVKKNFKKIDPENKAKNALDSILHFLITIFKGIFKVLAIIIGGILTLVGVILIAVFMAFLFGKADMNGEKMHFGDLNMILSQFSGTSMNWLAIIIIGIMCLIPIVALVYVGLKLIFKFKTNDRYFWISAAVVWIGCVIAFILLSISMARNISEESSKTSTFEINTKSYKTIVLTASSSPEVKETKGFFNKDDEKYLIDENDNIFGHARLIIELSKDSTSFINVEKRSRGYSYENANVNAQDVQYDIFQRDSAIVIDPYFGLKPNTKWRAQEVEVTIYIPAGTEVKIDKNLEDVLKDANVDGTYWMHELPGKKWLMTEKGLKMVE